MIRLKLKRLLGVNEMSQLEFAKLTGIRIPTVSLICNNKIKHLASPYQLESVDIGDVEHKDNKYYCTIKY